VKDSQADISKARRILGYEPIVSFEEGLKRTISDIAVASRREPRFEA
jgi:nucleoside-diphosphate-sugar epimerase